MKKIILSFIVVVMFALVSYTMLSDGIPVITFDEAISKSGKFQIKGIPIKEKNDYDMDNKIFNFYLMDDKNQEFAVHYKGIRPANYDQANEIIVIGHYNKENYVMAEKLLVKCPSKYEATGKESYELKEY
jgi:cytochrome c-type biogenesis protein CcmE